MGGSASCLSNLSVPRLSKPGKTKSRVIKVEALKHTQDVKRCQYCNCKNEECRLKISSDALKTPEKSRNVRCGTGNESIFVENSQFPFRRPKTLPVKPFIHRTTKPSDQKDLLIDSQGSDYAPKPIYGFYPYKSLQRLTISEPTTYLHGRAQQPTTFEELERSASYNPGMTRPVGHVLPHRTVEKLKSTESYQFFSRERYPPDIFTNHLLKSRHKDRPRTPWLPPSRTNDYLVASSLIAAEQERDRHLIGH